MYKPALWSIVILFVVPLVTVILMRIFAVTEPMPTGMNFMSSGYMWIVGIIGLIVLFALIYRVFREGKYRH